MNEKEYIDKILDLRAQLEAANEVKDELGKMLRIKQANLDIMDKRCGELKTQLEASEREHQHTLDKYYKLIDTHSEVQLKLHDSEREREALKCCGNCQNEQFKYGEMNCKYWWDNCFGWWYEKNRKNYLKHWTPR